MTDAPHQGPTAAQTPSPFTAEQLEQIAVARKRAVKVRRAAGVARFDAWTTAVFAGFTLMYVAVSVMFWSLDWVALFIGGGMAVVSYIAFGGAARLRRFDPRGPRHLALNQIFFAAMIIAYCLWRIWHVPSAANLAEQFPQLPHTVSFEQVRVIYMLVFSVVIFGSVLSQGGAALYYFTRGWHVRAFRDNTPPWVVELLAARDL